ncbi:MAG: site-specific integrase [Clostridiales bacterium]|nr:site-specific integrase [Clostridiales bacterium]
MTGRLVVKNGRYYVVISYQDSQGKNKQKWKATGLPVKNNKRIAEELMRDIVANFDPQVEELVKKNGTRKIKMPKSRKPQNMWQPQPTYMMQGQPMLQSGYMYQARQYMGEDMLFGDYLAQWIEMAKTNLQISTYSSYKAKIKQIAPYFNDRGITLQGISPMDIQTYYAWLIDNGKSVQSCTHAHVIIRRALEIAYRTDRIQVNPASKVEKPKSPKYEAKYYDLKQLKVLFEKLKGDKYELMYKMTAFYGLRRSELCGMRWSSIDFDNNKLTLNSSIVQASVNNKTVLVKKDVMKNAASKRTMPLIPEIKEALLKLKAEQDKNKAEFGKYYNQEYIDYVWVDEIGMIVNPNTLTCHFQNFLTQNELPKIRFHELRHSCASLLLACGVSMKEIQEWLGHSAISTTADIYSHLNYSSKLNVANTLTNAFGGEMMEHDEQDQYETKALLSNIFRGAEHEQAQGKVPAQVQTQAQVNPEPVEAATDEIKPNVKEILEKASRMSQDEILEDLDNSIAEYKKAKEEMAKLGFDDYDEYLDYLEYMERRAARKKDLEM